VGKYALSINKVNHYGPVKIHSLCILGQNWWYDDEALEILDAQKIFIKSRLDASWLRKVARFIDDLDPDIIMTHGFNGHFVALTTQIYTKRSIPFICSYHGLYHPTTLGRKIVGGVFNFMTERFIRHVAMSCVSVTFYTKNYLVQKKISTDKIEVIHNGTEDHKLMPNAREQLRNEWNIDSGEIVIGVASRLDPIKGINFLIDAFNELVNRHNNLRLLLIGSGSCKQELKNKIEDYGITDKTLFLGYRPDVPSCLEALDIFVLPSLAEYHSIGLLEAMRAGKAIVATSVGGNTESVRHMQEGLIVPPADVTALVEAINKIVEDPSFGKLLGKAARSRFQENFTEEIMVRRTGEWLVKCGELARRLG